MKIFSYKLCKPNKGFSLAEVIVALTIGSMVLVAILAIYNRAESSVSAITEKLDSTRLGSEVLQRIAEDIDRLIATGKDTKITINNKLNNLYPTARMEIIETYYDKKNEKQIFEKIVWQTSYDYESFDEGLVLYRSHSGMGTEDKLLDEEKEDWERELFVPVCSGVTFFKIQVPKYEPTPIDQQLAKSRRPTGSGQRSESEQTTDEEQIPEVEKFEDSWTTEALPFGIMITVSFAEPFKALDGSFDVYENQKFKRTIAIDRTRKIKFKFLKREERRALGLEDEPNDVQLPEDTEGEPQNNEQAPNQPDE